MPFGVKMVFSGQGDISAALAALEKKAPTAARKAMRKGTAIVQRSARQLAPIDTRLLRRNITSRVYLTRDKSAVLGEIFVGHQKSMVRRRGSGKSSVADPFNYAHLVELGTAPHALGKGSQRRIGRSKKNPQGRPGPQRGRMHPGARPHPFLRPALERNEGAVIGAIESVLDVELEKIWNGA
jgi:HK97 gp10 family phage protein